MQDDDIMPDQKLEGSTEDHGHESSPSYIGGFFPKGRDFAVSGGNFTSITNIANAPADAPPDFRPIPLGDIDLHREVGLRSELGAVHQRSRGSVRRLYSARIHGLPEKVTVALYQGKHAEKEWRNDISRYSKLRHPNLMQLFGTVSTGGLHAVIFHDELIPVDHLLSTNHDLPVWTVYFWGFIEHEFCDAARFIHALFKTHANTDIMTLWIRPASGRLCVDTPTEGDYPDYTLLNLLQWQTPHFPRLLGPHQHSEIIDSMPLATYHHLCWIHLSQTVALPIPIHASMVLGTINYDLPWSDRTIEIAFICDLPAPECDWYIPMHVGVVMEDGWTRLNSAALGHGTILRLIISLEHPQLYEAWLAQANHIFTHFNITEYDRCFLVTDVEYRLTISESAQPRTPGYLFLCPVTEVCSGDPPRVRLPDCPFYWSLDPTGAGRLRTHDVQDLGFPIIDIEMEFHYGKGFHPYSQDVARNLGLSPYQVSAPFAHAKESATSQVTTGSGPTIPATDCSLTDTSASRKAHQVNSHIPSQRWNLIMSIQFTLILVLTLSSLRNYLCL
ncbi:hypothetical protein B0H16DRAFT_1617600 [Mycena metata]|uniref:Protein kinase domain-containing protein n=1 Tax=Mycena metata TaxID=1033252 RepID=A0AAD7MFS0_9AGAR|nr:hypothetical protein B0H16DRAFT_1617600 [Mycena metata]